MNANGETPESPPREDLRTPVDPFIPFEDALRACLPTREEVLREAKAQSVHSRRRRLQAIAAGCVASCLGVLAWNPVLNERVVAVAAEAPRIWTTDEGSTIALDSHSILRLRTRLRTRDMRLEQGQAVFTVAANWRPFIVHVGHAVVRDIGTVFRVRRDAAGGTVDVLQGQVEVSSPSGRVVVSEGQALDARTMLRTPTTANDIERETLWREGKLRFDGTPLDEALANINRYRREPVRWEGGSLEDERALRLSGEYRIHNIESLIDSLPLVLPVTVSRLSDGQIRIAPR